jgi:uncharacterized phiE125 gp8 family phage protein
MIVATKPVRTVAAGFDPVTTSEAKKHLEIADAITTHDSFIGSLIDIATEVVESDTGVAICSSTWTYKLDSWPSEHIELPIRPVSAISSITYYDTGGTSQALSSAYYTLDNGRVVPLVLLNPNYDWPSLDDRENAVTITLTAGYATPSAVPKLYKQLVLLKIADMFLNREGYSIEGNRTEFDTAYNALLMRVIRSTYP